MGTRQQGSLPRASPRGSRRISTLGSETRVRELLHLPPQVKLNGSGWGYFPSLRFCPVCGLQVKCIAAQNSSYFGIRTLYKVGRRTAYEVHFRAIESVVVAPRLGPIRTTRTPIVPLSDGGISRRADFAAFEIHATQDQRKYVRCPP